MIIDAGMGMMGVALATTATDVFMLLSMSVWAHFLKDLRKAFKWPDRQIFSGLKDYLKLGLPMWMIILSNLGSSQIMSFFVGKIGVKELAAHTIFSNMKTLIYHIPLGLQTTSCVFIGKQIGKGDIAKGKVYLSTIWHITALSSIVFCVIYYVLEE